jgi:alpha-L-fucosidase
MGFARLRKESFFPDLLQKKGAAVFLNGKDISSLIKTPDASIKTGKNFREENIDIRFKNDHEVNCVVLKEALQYGQQVKSFEIECHDEGGLIFKKAYTTIGHQRILSFPAQRTNHIRIRITDAKSAPVFSGIEVFHIPEELVENK